MSGTWASGWALNDVVTVAEFAKGVGNVAETTLGASAASIDFTTLPTTYAHLRIFVQARSDTAASTTGLLLRFNNDTAANYDRQSFQASGTATAAAEILAGTSIELSANLLPANTAVASSFGHSVIDVANYAGTTAHKTVAALGAMKVNATTGNMAVVTAAGWWRSTAAINRVTLFPTAGNFVSGTRISVYVWGA